MNDVHMMLLRAFSFARTIRGSGHVQGIYPQTCPDGRRLWFRCAIQCWNSVAFRAAPLTSGRIVPRVTFIPRERPNANTRYCRLFKATTAYTSACTDAGAALKLKEEGKYFSVVRVKLNYNVFFQIQRWWTRELQERNPILFKHTVRFAKESPQRCCDK